MHLSGLDLFLWALGFFEHCLLLGVIWYRHRAGQFPIFTTLITLSVIRTIVLYFTRRYGTVDNYFYAYWTIAFLDIGLQFGVVYELASQVLRPLGAWATDVRRTFVILIGVSLLLASALTWLATPPTKTLRLAFIIRGQFFSSALMSELFVAMIALSVTMGFPWRTHVARITQGFGVYSIFGILTEAAHTYFGSDEDKHTYALVSQIRISLYLLCVLYWAFSLARNEPEPRQLPEQLRLELRALQARTALLLESLRGMGRA